MSVKITRTEEFATGERGPSWFQDFLRSFSEAKTSGIQDILDIINNTQHKSVENLVKTYREQVGLDLVGADEEDEDITKTASSIKPVAPMKLKKVDSLDAVLKDNKQEDLVVQVKLDGFKTSGIKTDGKTDLYTRRGEKFTENVPDVTEQINKIIPNGSYIMGELVWEDKDGKSSISDIQTVVGSSPDKAHAKIKEGGGKVIFYVYDILWKNGEEIVDKGYIDRYNILNKMVKGQSNIKVVKNYTWAEKDTAMKDATTGGNEGIVIKDKNSEYKYAPLGENEPHGNQWKYKKGVKAHTDEVILSKYEKGEDKLVFPAYQYKDNKLFEVGKLSGLGKENEEKAKKEIDSGKNIVVEVTYQERMESGKFRHMGWSRFRPDKPAKEVKMSSFRPLSVRHAMDNKNIVMIITNNPELKSAIDSFCAHSGGTKSTTSIIQFLREKLGKELVRFSDKDLIDYIEEAKERNKHHHEDDAIDVGRVGIDAHDEFGDNVADYVQHGGENVK